MKRENEKIVELFGRTFKITKFDAFTGSYILFQLMEKILPMGLEDKIPGEGETTLSEMMPASRTLMTKAEFEKLQRDCLLVVSEVLPAGARPCFNENGTCGLNDIENNTPLVLLLTIHSLVFNIGDFFVAGGLSELKKSLSGLSLANFKM